jgi:hypothetical protein
VHPRSLAEQDRAARRIDEGEAEAQVRIGRHVAADPGPWFGGLGPQCASLDEPQADAGV